MTDTPPRSLLTDIHKSSNCYGSYHYATYIQCSQKWFKISTCADVFYQNLRAYVFLGYTFAIRSSSFVLLIVTCGSRTSIYEATTTTRYKKELFIFYHFNHTFRKSRAKLRIIRNEIIFVARTFSSGDRGVRDLQLSASSLNRATQHQI